MRARIFGILTLSLILISLWAAFVYAPTEETMGNLQRVFYFHVPVAILGYVSAFVVAFAGVMFLSTSDMKWDRLGVSSAELCVLFIGTAMMMGSIWAKPAWGIWWAWDARGSLELVLWLIYVAYLMLRAYIEAPRMRGQLCAVFSILGAIDVPINYMSIRWWRTQHPQPVIMGAEGSGLDPDMKVAFVICFASIVVLYVYLLMHRMSVEKMKERVDELRHEADFS